MKTQACRPCSKRKVRCDRQEPDCGNCKRRKQDHCEYPAEASQPLRNQRAEVPIQQSTPETTPNGANIQNSETPVLLQEAGHSIYLESEGWQNWINAARLNGDTKPKGIGALKSIHTPGKHLPHAFEGSSVLTHTAESSQSQCPVPLRDAVRLWDTFVYRVEPSIKLVFGWTLTKLRTALDGPNEWSQLTQGEKALVLTCCYFSVSSLTKDECLEISGQTKADLLLEYRHHSERLFAINMLAIDDMTMLQALCIYMKASIELVTTRSLWSLMGLVSRSAEQMGIHRDGQLLGLSAIETETRRRLWWQLQHVDLILAIKSGATPLTFSADWDTKLPLNIEDADLHDSHGQIHERVGLTSLSFTLFTHFVIEQQRSFRQKQMSEPTLSDRSLLGPLTDQMIDRLEAGLNNTFLQYCDPIQPWHTLLQIAARAVVCILRLRRLHEARLSSKHFDDSSHDEYFKTCQQSVQYVITSYSLPSLKPYRWLAETSFAWHAFIGILVDMPQLNNIVKLKSAWSLLENLYTVTTPLMDLEEDRRRVHAASSVVATWDACQRKPGMESMQKPAFVTELEHRLAQLEATERQAQTALIDPWQVDSEIGDPFNFNFADIDWSFWESIS